MTTATIFAPNAGRLRLSLSDHLSILVSKFVKSARWTALWYVLFLLYIMIFGFEAKESVIIVFAAIFIGIAFGIQPTSKRLSSDELRSLQFSTGEIRKHTLLAFVMFGVIVQLSLLLIYLLIERVSLFEDSDVFFAQVMWASATVVMVVALITSLWTAHEVDPTGRTKGQAGSAKESALNIRTPQDSDGFVLDALVYSRFRSGMKSAMKAFWIAALVLAVGVIGTAWIQEKSIDPAVLVIFIVLPAVSIMITPGTLARTFANSMAFSVDRAQWANIPYRILLPSVLALPAAAAGFHVMYSLVRAMSDTFAMNNEALSLSIIVGSLCAMTLLGLLLVAFMPLLMAVLVKFKPWVYLPAVILPLVVVSTILGYFFIEYSDMDTGAGVIVGLVMLLIGVLAVVASRLLFARVLPFLDASRVRDTDFFGWSADRTPR